VSVPKGGGAIRGIGEKFAANPVTGTGSFAVPIATSPGRSEFGPQLALSYDSGAGNGPFGFGWNLSLPSITRKTDRGLPRYLDSEESDEFILSGAEDLVPALEQVGGQWRKQVLPPRVEDGKEFRVERYRPRTEGLFARIERWTNLASGDVHWRSISRENITTVYGRTNGSRIFDPTEPGVLDDDGPPPSRVFSWLICESYDDRGNAIVYDYKREDSQELDVSSPHERNRTTTARRANLYLKSIKYGNRISRLIQPGLFATDWMFEVVFDYGEHDDGNPTPDDQGVWYGRHDPFSTYRSGFEVRTYRLCQRVLMFHHFPGEQLPGEEEIGRNCLIRSTDFAYRSTRGNPEDERRGHPIASFIASVTQRGYRRRTGGGYIERSLPPLEFEYTMAELGEEVHEVDSESLENLPQGVDGSVYRWVDLDGEGVSGVLTEQGEAWYYKPNQGEGRFGPVRPVAAKPSLAAPNAGGQQLLDLGGDGKLDLVQFAGPTPGFYERTFERAWAPFNAFQRIPQIAWDDANLRFVDLTGDGHADVLVTENDVFTWYASLGEEGFEAAQSVTKALDEDTGPRLVFADGEQAVYLADMSGDGLTDLVRIRNGEVCYWPSLGYGRFGAKVTMDNAPWFDYPDRFNQQRVRVADIDGSGNTDIIYLSASGPQLYFNESGNHWSDARQLSSFPAIDNVSAVQTADLKGNGTACLVWSSTLPGDAGRQMRYVDLMGGTKPHLLILVRNNLGAETRVHYAPSTRFYLGDEEAGRPWITRLPFPVHVVDRVEVYDHIARNRFVTRYVYHHGYFDGVEREFRGFGLVEQWDTEEIRAVTDRDFAELENLDKASYVPPVLTRTWFHTGAFIDGQRISRLYEDGYYREPGLTDEEFQAQLLPDTTLPEGVGPDEMAEACRTLRGSILRQEIYRGDDTPQVDPPYSVSERTYAIRQVQPRGENAHAVFFIHPAESLDYHYERNPTDPRIGHSLTLDVDEFGNVLAEAAVGYGRRQPDLTRPARDRPAQTQTLITYTENRYTNEVDEERSFRTPLPCETRTYELTGLLLPNSRSRFSRVDLLADARSAAALPYERTGTPGRVEKRLIEHARTLYRRDNLSGPLPLAQVQSLALPFESYKLALTAGLVADVYADRVTAAMLAGEGGYVRSEGDDQWWVPSGRVFYSAGAADSSNQELAYARSHFFLPLRARDPFGNVTTVEYDQYDLLVRDTRDPLDNRITTGERDRDGNIVTLRNDYRVLQPTLVMDPNRNRTAVAFDALGMVTATAVRGKPEEPLGDRLERFERDVPEEQLREHLAHPLGAGPPEVAAQIDPHDLLGAATTRLLYDLHAYVRPANGERQPAVVYSLARETHESDLALGELTKIQHTFSYSDGFAREIQKKVRAEPGPVPRRNPITGKIVTVDGRPVMSDGDPDGDPPPRWVGSGWTVFNNKGKTVRQYEPFFTDRHRFEFDEKIGVSPVLFYDPVERVIATLHPNHAWEKAAFDPWRQEAWDVNDTVLTDPEDPLSGVAGLFTRLPRAEYFPTWRAARSEPNNPEYAGERRRLWPADGLVPSPQREAATKTEAHAGTPAITHFDALGRAYVSVAQNRKLIDTPIEEYFTRTVLDIEGNQREVIDALDRVVMRYDYDMLGNRIHQASMEAGQRWTLLDVGGNPARAWDSREHRLRSTYDGLRRPVSVFLSKGDNPEVLVEHRAYGELEPLPEAENLRGQLYQVLDQAGVVTTDEYDFKGNLVRNQRQLAQEYKRILDWSAAVPLEVVLYISRTTFDALNRPITATSPDDSVYHPTFNQANLLEKVDVNLRGAAAATSFVTNIDYDAKGQRERITYGNGAVTTYDYDRFTFRLTNMKTTRPPGVNGVASGIFVDPTVVQDIRYTYDPAHNITLIADIGLKIIFHNNEHVEPVGEYSYDAMYRLIEAGGREHIGQNGFDFNPRNCNYRDHPHIGHRTYAHDLQALRNYTERYEYDAVGNIGVLRHLATAGSWKRRYDYEEGSLIEAGKENNRLTRTRLGNGINRTEPYRHDAHGNMISMPQATAMVWDFEDQLQQIDLGGCGMAHYVYDAAGQRVRKVIESQNGTRRKERIYLGGYEIYCEYNSDGSSKTLERESLHVMDDKQRVALVETQTIENGSPVSAPAPLQRYQLGNHLGSSRVELAEDRTLISYEEYHPYGTTAFQGGRSAAEVSLKRFRHTGKERDEESGLYYHGARYYAPWVGKWITSDPAGILGGINLYEYCRSKPIRCVDPFGTQSRDPQGETFVGPTLRLDTESLRFSPSAFQLDSGLNLTQPHEPELRTSVFVGAEDPGGTTSGSPGSVGTPKDEERSFFSRGGGTLLAGAAGIGIGALIVLSGPVGWFGALVAGMAIAGGTTGVGVGTAQLALSYTGQTTPEQERQLNEAASTAMMLSSPGGLVGGTLGVAVGGDEDSLRRGALMGGFAEAGGSAAFGLSRMALRERSFSQLYQQGSFNWQFSKRLKPAIRQAFGAEAGAARRSNQLFNWRGQPIEFRELSHFIPQRATRGFERLFNRPWNLSLMWGTEHALVDPRRWQFMTAGFKASYGTSRFRGAPQLLRRTPDWLQNVGLGVGLHLNLELRLGIGD
jgi:RHS repeat-associated protein